MSHSARSSAITWTDEKIIPTSKISAGRTVQRKAEALMVPLHGP